MTIPKRGMNTPEWKTNNTTYMYIPRPGTRREIRVNYLLPVQPNNRASSNYPRTKVLMASMEEGYRSVTQQRRGATFHLVFAGEGIVIPSRGSFRTLGWKDPGCRFEIQEEEKMEKRLATLLLLTSLVHNVHTYILVQAN